MIKPTIGRVVLVYRGSKHIGSQWNEASIVEVHSDTLINVAGFDRNGDSFRELSITLRQDDVAQDPISPPSEVWDKVEPFACWMPYQRKVNS